MRGMTRRCCAVVVVVVVVAVVIIVAGDVVIVIVIVIVLVVPVHSRFPLLVGAYANAPPCFIPQIGTLQRQDKGERGMGPLPSGNVRRFANGASMVLSCKNKIGKTLQVVRRLGDRRHAPFCTIIECRMSSHD